MRQKPAEFTKPPQTGLYGTTALAGDHLAEGLLITHSDAYRPRLFG
jgi:hypothetical protein